jgi:hypothetical protein
MTMALKIGRNVDDLDRRGAAREDFFLSGGAVIMPGLYERKL